jgi:putative phosphoribosyl transferase
MKFASRSDAGCRLGKFLRMRGVSADMVLGLPRGGVVVAAGVAAELGLPLDILVVRKIGHPLQREFAVGALAEPDVLMLDEKALSGFSVARSELGKVIAEETGHLREYRARFRRSPAPSLKDQTVLLVDDGLATGATAETAVVSVRQQKARRIIVAAPVASTSAFKKMERAADEVVVLVADPGFTAVGEYYDDFSQTTDDEVIALLSHAAPRGS